MMDRKGREIDEACARSVEQQGIRVEHVLNSLAQIELWIGAVRSALSGLPPDLQLRMTAKTKQWVENGAIRVEECCPPPSVPVAE